MIKLPKTLQEIFDIVSKHLLTQVKRSMGCVLRNLKVDTCAYRGKDGMKCAAGILIPDNQYDSSFEGSFWDDLVKMGSVEDKFSEEICELQYIHDQNHDDNIDCLKPALVNFAVKHKLLVNFEV